MSYSLLYALWGGMYLLCAGLGFIEETSDLGYALLVLVGMLFFVPPGCIVYKAVKENNKDVLTTVRNLCLLSLGLTLSGLMAAIVSALGSDIMGAVVQAIRVLGSAPMACCRWYIISLFGWSCLLMTTRKYLKK